jgi:hypothetical protein
MNEQEEMIPELIEQLSNGNLIERQKATAKLNKIGKPAEQALFQALKSGNCKARRGSIEVLINIGDYSVATALIEILKNKDAEEWNMAFVALGNIKNISAVPALFTLLNYKEKARRSIAAHSIRKIIENCKSIDEVQFVEKKLTEGLALVKTKYRDKKEFKKVQFQVLKLKIHIAERKNELAEKKDILLPDKPKLPKKGRIFNQLRGVRNG